ncbi:MAG: RelA/SpoT family protein [Muribaculaceae bacterium]
MDNKANLTTPEEDRMVDDAFRDMLNGYLASNHRKKVEIIERAYRFAKDAHAGVRRRSGEPYILHPIAVAKIASQEIGLGSTSICAALLHDVVEDTEYTVEDIRAHFGDKVAQIVWGLTKISGGIFGDRASAQAENFRKLLLTMSEDIRVILIKMADRLHNMRTLGSMAPNKQYKIAGETLYIYAPLAHRLGLFAIKTELEDLSFKYEHPKAWQEITEKIRQSEERRQSVYSDFAAPIRERLEAMGLDYEVKARVKSCYSIWKKMQTKHIPFEEVYDLYAVRIVFKGDKDSEKETCWKIYSAITDLYRLHPERTRDWISVPKANGYQALHLTVMGPDGNWIEVQIRSERMDEIAEKGFAAHWKYKIGEGEEESELSVWLQTIKDILDNPEPSAIDFLDTLKLNLFASEIVVFTPKGELITLPTDSTVLDVAFALHTDLGLHCIAGKVNHRLVPLDYRLSSGDQVEVLTSQTQQPQREWMNFLKTAKAKTRLRQALRRERQPLTQRGHEMLDDFLSQHGLADNNQTRPRLLARFGAVNSEDLWYMVGNGDAVLDDSLATYLRGGKKDGDRKLLNRLLRSTFNIVTRNNKDKKAETEAAGQPAEAGAETAPAVKRPEINTKETYILRYDEHGANFRLADCCNPIPGDEVMGFIDDNGEVVVHALNCPRALVLKAGYGNRILSTRWAVSGNKFMAHIRVEGIDRRGILQEITGVISVQKDIDLRRLDIEATGEVFHSDIWLRVEDTDVVGQLCDALTEVSGVERATRIQ